MLRFSLLPIHNHFDTDAHIWFWCWGQSCSFKIKSDNSCMHMQLEFWTCTSLVPRPRPQERKRVWWLLSDFLVVLTHHCRVRAQKSLFSFVDTQSSRNCFTNYCITSWCDISLVVLTPATRNSIVLSNQYQLLTPAISPCSPTTALLAIYFAE